MSQEKKRWIIPIGLLLFSIFLWITWLVANPTAIMLWYTSSAFGADGMLAGMPVQKFFLEMHQVLQILAIISIVVSLLTILATKYRPDYQLLTTVFAVATIFYAFSAIPWIKEQSGAPHYVYLADAFAHGRLALESEPVGSADNDWTFYNGEWTVSFPPTPAILMVPFVAIWGKNFNDVIFTLLLAAFNVALIYQLFGKIYFQEEKTLPEPARLLLAIAFGVGTAHWWLAISGNVWYTAHIVATTFLLAALFETFGKRRLWIIMLFVGFAALARPPIVFSLPVFLWFLRKEYTWKKMIVEMLPLAFLALSMAIYNFLRYDNPLEIGYHYMQIEGVLAENLVKYGSFNLVYLKTNLYHAFLNAPLWQTYFPYMFVDGLGLSIFISTPLVLYAFFAPWREKNTQMMGVAALLVALPDLLYYNTGYFQVSYRYALDFLPFLFVLIALSWRGRTPRLGVLLTGLSVLMGFFTWLSLTSYL